MGNGMNTELGRRMRRFAEEHPHQKLPEDWFTAADAFDRAAAGYFANPQTVTVGKFVGCFARARRMWCEATGERLV